jgi:hypothetical protein
MENPNNPEYYGSPNIGANRIDPNTINMSQRELQELQDQIQSQPQQRPQQQSQQSQEQSQEPSTLEDNYRHYFSVPNNSPKSSNSKTYGMTDEEEKAYYGYSNHPNVAPRNMTPAPRNMTPAPASAPASAPAPAPDNTPPRLWEMAKKYVRTAKDGFRDNVYFYKDDDKNTSPMIGIVWDTSINPFKKTYEIRSANGPLNVNKVYTPDFEKRISGGGRLRKSKKMYKKRNVRKNSKSKSKRRHSRSRSRRH